MNKADFDLEQYYTSETSNQHHNSNIDEIRVSLSTATRPDSSAASSVMSTPGGSPIRMSPLALAPSASSLSSSTSRGGSFSSTKDEPIMPTAPGRKGSYTTTEISSSGMLAAGSRQKLMTDTEAMEHMLLDAETRQQLMVEKTEVCQILWDMRTTLMGVLNSKENGQDPQLRRWIQERLMTIDRDLRPRRHSRRH